MVNSIFAIVTEIRYLIMPKCQVEPFRLHTCPIYLSLETTFVCILYYVRIKHKAGKFIEWMKNIYVNLVDAIVIVIITVK